MKLLCYNEVCGSEQAFRPSTVDLGPVSRAQVRAITMEEPAGVSALDLDLSLDLDPSELLASG